MEGTGYSTDSIRKVGWIRDYLLGDIVPATFDRPTIVDCGLLETAYFSEHTGRVNTVNVIIACF